MIASSFRKNSRSQQNAAHARAVFAPNEPLRLSNFRMGLVAGARLLGRVADHPKLEHADP